MLIIKLIHHTQFYNRDILASKSETLGKAQCIDSFTYRETSIVLYIKILKYFFLTISIGKLSKYLLSPPVGLNV